MKLNPFALERFFAKHEFSAPYLLSCSDPEALTLNDLLALADEESLALWQSLSLGYTESQGHPLLLDEIASLYTGLERENIVEIIPEEGIFTAMNVLLSKGDHVVATYPGYQSLTEIAAGIGCEISRWHPDLEGDMRFSVESLAPLIRDNTRLIIINFPHNPTGALLTGAELEQVVEMAEAHGIMIFSDEMYRYSEIDPDDRLPSVCEIYPKGITLGGLSKSFALPGLRVGWLATRNEETLAAVKTFKDYTTICGSAPSEILALMALRARTRILHRVVSIIFKNLTRLDTFFAEHADIFRWRKPKAGTVAFPELTSGEDVSAFCDALLKDKGVLLVPAPIFGLDNNHFRIGYGRINMPEALAELDAFLKETRA